MRYNRFKLIGAFLAVGFFTSAFAQKQDKKFTETFNVNKDVVVEIDATNTEIDVTAWNKNQVQVEAVIEVEGLTKKESEKYLKNYKFEALGNSSKVKITSKGNGFYALRDNLFIFNDTDFDFPEVIVPDMHIMAPDVEAIVLPDMDFEKIFQGLDKLEFDFDKYHKDGENYFFRWKDSAKNITIKSRKEWKKFKKSDEYKQWKKEMKKKLAKMKIELKNVNKDAVKEALEKAKIAIAKVDINRELAKVKKKLGNVKTEYFFDTDSDAIVINNKKVKIKKRITIKVPKNATFDLNTRHCKVTLPKTKASGKVSYGSFNAGGLQGGDLRIYYSPVTINSLNTCTLFLNNVTDASLASVTNTTINSNSSGLKIEEAFSKTNLESSFGDVIIKKVNPTLTDFKLVLNQSNATIDLSKFKNKLSIDTKGNKGEIVSYNSITGSDKEMLVRGNFVISTEGEKLAITGKYSELTIKN
ncbi:MAG: hypothetical protein GKR88_11655 [Flavobacteriaceae bacterium]|nr:MAG: hypothetical protein GKR88_11655 [Flavobacteriaceae bacterium]